MPTGPRGEGSFKDTTISRFWLRRIAGPDGRPVLQEFHAREDMRFANNDPSDYGRWSDLVDNGRPPYERGAYKVALEHYWMRHSPLTGRTETYNSATERWVPYVEGARTPR